MFGVVSEDAHAWERAKYYHEDGERRHGCRDYLLDFNYYAGPWRDNATRRMPQVGMGVTQHCFSDRRPATIVEVINESKIRISFDNYQATRITDYGGPRHYAYSDGPRGFSTILTYRKTSRHEGWFQQGQSVKSSLYTIGHREAYFDPHF